MSTGLHCFVVGVIVYWQGTIVKFGRPGKDGSVLTVAEPQNHDTGRGGRTVTEVHGSVTGIQNKAVNGGMEKRVGTEV